MSVLSDRVAGLISYLEDPLLEALADGMLEAADDLSLIAHGDGGTIRPWQALTDPNTAELWALPYAAQWTGGIMPTRFANETDTDYLARARAELDRPRGMWRGGKESLSVIAQGFLTGNKTVRIFDRALGQLWNVLVLVKTAECPDATALSDALHDPEIWPAGFIITVGFDDTPIVDEGAIPIDSTAGTVTIDAATLDDVT